MAIIRKSPLGPGSRGAIAEHLVCADLLSRGAQVFVNASPNGPVDLVALVEGRFWRVQVKSKISPMRGNGAYDVFASVWEKDIRYYGDGFPFGRGGAVKCSGLSKWSGRLVPCGVLTLHESGLCNVHRKAPRVMTEKAVPFGKERS